MAKTYADNFKLTWDITAENAVDIGTAKYAPTYTYTSAFTNGSGSGQAELIYTDQRTLSASTSEDLDLYGSLSDHFGDTINGVTLKRLVVEASSSNGDHIVVGGAASNTMLNIFSDSSDKITIDPGGLFVWSSPAGAAITASTGDLLTIENADSGANGTYKILMAFTD